jgi:small-conductance mechanosensitive channel
VLKILQDTDVIKGIVAALGVLAILFASRWVRRSIVRRVVDASTRYQARKVTVLVGHLAVVILISVVFWRRLTGLTVFFGAAGAGIAFALREVVVSVAGWLAISFGGYYRIGDRVQLGGTKGDVIDISILRTTLMEIGEWVQSDLYTGRIVRIANSFAFTAPVFNYSGDFPFLWDEIHVPVRYGGDREQARRILEQVAGEIVDEFVSAARATYGEMQLRYRIEKATIDPLVTLIANDNWLEYTVRYIVNYRLRRLTKDRLFSRILEEFDKTAGKVAFASTTVRLVGLPQVSVRLEGDAE